MIWQVNAIKCNRPLKIRIYSPRYTQLTSEKLQTFCFLPVMIVQNLAPSFIGAITILG